jgi:hypothetical protein
MIGIEHQSLARLMICTETTAPAKADTASQRHRKRRLSTNRWRG